MEKRNLSLVSDAAFTPNRPALACSCQARSIVGFNCVSQIIYSFAITVICLTASANALFAKKFMIARSTYGGGIGVAAARGHLDVPVNPAGVAAALGHLDVPVIVALEPSVVSDVGPRLSSGVGLGASADFELAPCPAPWLAPPPTPWLAPPPTPWLAPCPVPFDFRAREDFLACVVNVLSAP
jgi:hypothetical protein